MPVISFSTFRRDVTTNVGIGCLNVKDDIEVELSHKISKLDSSNGTEDIRQKCEEINKFLNEQKNVYNVCYEHRYKESLWYTPIIIKKILSESTEYNKCPQKWTLEPEEATKLTVKEEESHDENEKQTSAENISEFPQHSALPRSSDSTPDFGTDQKTDHLNVSPAVEALPPNHSSSHDSQITEENSDKYNIIKYITEDNIVLPEVSDNHALGDTKFCVEIFDNVETADTYSYGDGSVKYVTCEIKPDDENPANHITFKLLPKLTPHSPDNNSRSTNNPQPNNCIGNSQLGVSTQLSSVESHTERLPFIKSKCSEIGEYSLSEKSPEIQVYPKKHVSREKEKTTEPLSTSTKSSDIHMTSNSGEDSQGPFNSDGTNITINGEELDILDSKTENFPLKDYIVMAAVVFGIITLFSFLLKFTPLGLHFSKKKRENKQKIEAQIQEILSGQSGDSQNFYMPYGSQN